MPFFGDKEAEPAIVGDKPFVCTVCGNDRFIHRRAQMNTAVATFFKLDWANRSAECLVCSKCRYVHWFLRE
jgi:predicted nucleic-acid-binding Zn-ribbon protein